MTIQTFSPLQNGGVYNLTSDTFGSELMFIDSNSKLYYSIFYYDREDDVYKVSMSGILNGFSKTASNYNYRLDFDKFIKVENNNSPVAISGGTNQDYFFSYNLTYMYLIICTSPVLQYGSNQSLITYKDNGEIWVNDSPGELDYNIYSNSFQFYNKNNSDVVKLSSSDNIYTESYYPITIYNAENNGKIWFTAKNNGTTLYTYTGLTNSVSIAGKVYMFYIPSNATTIEIGYTNTGSDAGRINVTKNVNTKTCVIQPYYFWNTSGAFDVIYTEGNSHEVNNITKDWITVNDKQYPILVKKQKQYKVNTGYFLTQEQVYSLINAPYIFKSVINNNILTLQRFKLDTSMFEGYTDSMLSDRNIELLLTDEKTYKTYNNPRLGFYD